MQTLRPILLLLLLSVGIFMWRGGCSPEFIPSPIRSSQQGLQDIRSSHGLGLLQSEDEDAVSNEFEIDAGAMGQTFLRYAQAREDPLAIIAAVNILTDATSNMDEEEIQQKGFPSEDDLLAQLDNALDLARRTTEWQGDEDFALLMRIVEYVEDSTRAVTAEDTAKWRMGARLFDREELAEVVWEYSRQKPEDPLAALTSSLILAKSGRASQDKLSSRLREVKRTFMNDDSIPGFMRKQAWDELWGGLEERVMIALERPAETIAPASSSDWPGFLGKNGDGRSAETGLRWPLSAPRILWQKDVGAGFGASSASGGRVYIFDRLNDRNRISCYSADTGEPRWDRPYEYAVDFSTPGGYAGPRCTPVVDEDRVYIFDEAGRLFCLDATNGTRKWPKPNEGMWVDTSEAYNVVPQHFGVASTPVIEGDLLLVMVGGSREQYRGYPSHRRHEVEGHRTAIVAFNKFTGDVAYELGDYLADCASIKLATVNGVRWGFAFVREGLVGFDPRTGKEIFHHPWRSRQSHAVNATTPVVVEDKLFLSTAYGLGGAQLKIKADGTEVVWPQPPAEPDRRLQAHFSTPVYHDGYLYGSFGESSGDAELRCVRWRDGHVEWSQRGLRRLSLIYAEGHLICLTEDGKLLLVRATPDKFDKVAEHTLRSADPTLPVGFKASPLLNSCWTAPVLANGRLFLRGDQHLVCLDLLGPGMPLAGVGADDTYDKPKALEAVAAVPSQTAASQLPSVITPSSGDTATTEQDDTQHKTAVSPEAGETHAKEAATPELDETHSKAAATAKSDETHAKEAATPELDETHSKAAVTAKPDETHAKEAATPEPEETHSKAAVTAKPDETHAKVVATPEPEETSTKKVAAPEPGAAAKKKAMAPEEPKASPAKPNHPPEESIRKKPGDKGSDAIASLPANGQISTGKRYALLIGCTYYPNLNKRFHLEGPANDVELMQELLLGRFGFSESNIRVLSEAFGEGSLPTRANIKREWERLAQVAKRGDHVVVLMAGHGSQVPQQDAAGDPEPDGLDEVFLPRDVGTWNDTVGNVENAIPDDDIRRWVEAVHQNGASLYVIVDACHSGTMIRAAGDEVRRQLDPVKSLQVPQEIWDSALVDGDEDVQLLTSEPAAPTDPADGQPVLMALYAAQSTEPTVEKRLPSGGANRKYYGLLTYTLNQVLTKAESPLTYRDLLERIHRQYRSWGRLSPTPLVEGRGLDRQVLGYKSYPERARIRLAGDAEGWRINAGAVAGLTRGSVLAVFPPAGATNARTGEALGHVRILDDGFGALEARVEGCEHAQTAAPAELTAGMRCVPVFVDYGDQRLRIAVDVTTEENEPAPADGLAAASEALRQLGAEHPHMLQIVDHSEETDWFLRYAADELFLVPASGWHGQEDGQLSPLFGPAPAAAELPSWLSRGLTRIARVQTLLRLAERGATEDEAGLRVSFSRYAGRGEKPIEFGREGITLYDGDRIAVRVLNETEIPQDVTMLLINDSYGITTLYPSAGTNRVQPGNRIFRTGRLKTTTAGVWHLMVIAVEGEAVAEPASFAFLSQSSIPRTRASIGTALESPLGRLLNSALFGREKTRGLPANEIGKYRIRTISWTTLPTARPE